MIMTNSTRSLGYEEYKRVLLPTSGVPPQRWNTFDPSVSKSILNVTFDFRSRAVTQSYDASESVGVVEETRSYMFSTLRMDFYYGARSLIESGTGKPSSPLQPPSQTKLPILASFDVYKSAPIIFKASWSA